MVRFPNQRLASLFDALLVESLPQEELARRFNVSTRTVRADIHALNAILTDYGSQLVLNRGSGYQLNIDDEPRFATLRQQVPRRNRSPRSSAERITALMVRFLNSAYACKMEDLADEWYISRGTLQSDMAEVRDRLTRYDLSIETKPRHGMKLFGKEAAIRVCLTDIMYASLLDERDSYLLASGGLPFDILAQLTPSWHQSLGVGGIKLTDEGEQYLALYCSVAIKRIQAGYPLPEFPVEEVDEQSKVTSAQLARLIEPLTGKGFSAAERNYLCIHIAARRVQDINPSAINADDDETLVDYLLSYINTHYNYDLQNDSQLRADLLTHIKTMITRVRYQITIPNPLLANIKQHYPMAYDVTLAAVNSWGKYTPYVISENEIGYLVLHIGVGLERHYNIGYQRHPQVLLVCDSGNSTVRMIQAMLTRKYPQIAITQVISLREYETLPALEEDFVISTVRLAEKNKPVMVLAPFPSDYQLEQLGKLVLVDRTRPYMLEKFFADKHFMIVHQPMTQQALFKQVCAQLKREGVVEKNFYPSVVEREAIVSTMLGEGIALPHSLGLLARQTVIYTILAPQGVAWGDNETAYVIFLLAINKTDYEEAMAIYELFVTFVRERSMPRLRDSGSFADFKAVAIDSLSRA